MQDYFQKKLYAATLLDHNDQFRARTVPIEIRTDLFTGRVSRILQFRWKLPQSSHDPELIARSRSECPFCPERLETSTPKFPEEIIEGGRLRFGRSILLPNAYPYCPYCGVAVFAETHYIPMDQLKAEILYDALMASQRFIELVHEHDPEIAYASINWNYMPTAGGSLVHPHFQVVANQEPTHFHTRLLRSSADYRETYGRNYWTDLLEYERKHLERYLFRTGDIEFLSCYSPGGIFGEVLALFTQKLSLAQISEEVWQSFLNGLTRILRCFWRLHLDNLNMTLLLSLKGDDDFWLQARIMPRICIPPWATSDVNYFEKGHDEKIVIFSPEDLAREIRATD